MRHLFLGFAVLLWVALAQGAVAQNLAPFQPSETQNKILDQIQDHLQSIKTLQGKFVQASSNGNSASGKFYLARPNRLRFIYDDKNAPQIIADGTHLIYYDPRLEQVTYLSIDRSPLAPLLQDPVNLRDPSLALRDLRVNKGKIQLSFVKRDDPSGGEVTLVFNAAPLYFDRWIIRDAQDVITTVSLTEARLGGVIDRKLFVFDDPRPASRRTE
jgi:outer membrane lipoprotein-sorting protein